MKRIYFMLICTMSLLPGSLFAQKDFPHYLDVVKKFFTSYTHEREEPYDRIFFAKKKDGWFVDIVDISNKDSVKKEQLFWSAAGKKYNLLTGFGEGLSNEEADKKIDSMMTSSESPFVYGYERCPYFGYAEWASDIIKDFGGSVPQNDTLAEGLARAYSSHADKFLWNYAEYVSGSELPVRKLGRIELPGKDRIDKYNYYINKDIDCYKTINRRNPTYKVIVGNAGMKLLNEQMNQWLELSMGGYNNEAKRIMDTLPANDSVYMKIAYIYLNSCPPNSILITFGDNDTYPLWYVQQKKGYRKDVTVLNNSLLGLAPYINMLKRERIVNFSSESSFYGKDGYDYFTYDETGPPNITTTTLSGLIQEIQQKKHPSANGAAAIPTYQAKTINYKIDLAQLKKICNQDNLTTNIVLELKDNILLGDFMILDIVNTNMYSRPVCFTSNYTLFDEKYLQQEGTVYRLLPIDEKSGTVKTESEIKKIENYLLKNISPVLISCGTNSKIMDDALFGTHARLFSKLIAYYSKSNNQVKADEWASKYIAAYKPENMNYSMSDLPVAEALIKTSFVKQATGIIQKITANILAGYKNYNALQLYNSKKSDLEWLEYMKQILQSNQQSSEILEKAIEELSKEEN